MEHTPLPWHTLGTLGTSYGLIMIMTIHADIRGGKCSLNLHKSLHSLQCVQIKFITDTKVSHYKNVRRTFFISSVRYTFIAQTILQWAYKEHVLTVFAYAEQ